MKTKVLILGAEPPFEGPWVPISDSEVWWSYAESIPTVAGVSGCLLEVVDEHDSIIPLSLGARIQGVGVRATCKKNGVSNVTVYITEKLNDN